MKVRVIVTPKTTVLDPQGSAVEHAMESLGYCKGRGVRVGKVIEFEVDDVDGVDRICEELLSNPVIEDYAYEVVGS